MGAGRQEIFIQERRTLDLESDVQWFNNNLLLNFLFSRNYASDVSIAIKVIETLRP